MSVKKKRIRKKTLPELIEDIDMDPRRQKFAAAYLDPMSNTYANALQSALKVGFAVSYAEKILSTKPQWFGEIVRQTGNLEDARRNLDTDLNLPTETPVLTAFGPYKDKNKKMMYLPNPEVIAKRQKATFLVLEALDPRFKKKEKNDPTGQVVVFTQIIIKDANGGSIVYDANPQQITRDQADGETDRSVPEAA